MNWKKELIFGTLLLVLTVGFVAASGESVVEISGQVEIIFSEEHNINSNLDFFIHTPDGEVRTFFEEDNFPHTSGEIVRAMGYFEGDNFIVDEYQILNDGFGPGNLRSIGGKRVAVVLVNFQDNPIEPVSLEEVEERFFDAESVNSPNHWVDEVSYGRAWMTGDVYGWFTLPYDHSDSFCGLSYLRNRALPAVDPYIDFREYDIISFIQPDGFCNFGGAANVGGLSRVTQDGTLVLSFNSVDGVARLEDGVMAHELGHNFGLWHANNFECGEVSYVENCYSIEYGGLYDIMGPYQSQAHFGAVKKEILGWLFPSEVIEDPDDGYHFISPIEFSGGIKALKFSLSGEEKVYAEYRRPRGYDDFYSTFYGGNSLNGLILNTNHYLTFGDSQLIDTTPESNMINLLDNVDAALVEGEAFSLDNESIYFETVELTDEYAKVRVGRPICGDGIMDAHKGEQCDGNDFGETSCIDFSSLGSSGLVHYDGGDMACRSDCTFDTNQCVIRESCPWDQDGNGFVNAADRGFVSVQIGCQVGRGNPICDLADVNDDGFVTAGDRGFIAANIGMCSD